MKYVTKVTGRRIARNAFFILPLSLIILLSGCLRDNADDCQQPVNKRSIVFTPAVKSADDTRAASAANGGIIESNNNIPNGGKFGVYAYSNISNTVASFSELQDMPVENKSGSFEYSPEANWPIGSTDKLAFYGYYPYHTQTGTPAVAVTMGAPASPGMSIAYTCAADPANQLDLMWSYTDFNTGFDPVEMVFGHALTRIRFKAKKEDYVNYTTVVTGIKIKGAKTKGTLAWTNATDAAWSGLSTAADITLTSSNGLTGTALTSGLVSQLTGADKDLVLIPQVLDNLAIEVTATVSGESKIYTYPLAGSPKWEMNRIVTYEITVKGDGTLDIRMVVNNWDDSNPVMTIFDGKYYLELSHDRLDFDTDGGAVDLIVKTNYPGGSTIDAAGTDTWAALSNQSQTGPSGGEYTRTVKITAGTTAVARATSFVVTAGNMNYVFKIAQGADLWLEAEPMFYPLDGDMYGFNVTSTRDWTVAVDAATNNKYTQKMITNLLTQQGRAGAGTVNFVTCDDISKNSPQMGIEKVKLTFTDASGDFTKDVEVTLLSQFTNTPITASTGNTYVGAFWRAGETAERVIRIPAGVGSTGKWSARLFDRGKHFAKSDILFAPSTYTTYPLATAASEVTDGMQSVHDDTANANNEIKFRIGLAPGATLANPDVAPRYAVAVIGYANYTKFQKLWLRQGEADDYVMAPDDVDDARRGQVRKYSAYNLTASLEPGEGLTTNLEDYAVIPDTGGTFTEYPTQAGAMFMWSAKPDYKRRAWHPVKTYRDGVWKAANGAESGSSFSTEDETCPPGYRRPTTEPTNATSTTTSEVGLSLVAAPGPDNTGNSVWGYYADGFFDRRSDGTAASVESNDYQVAYNGRLFYNDSPNNKNASIFFPAAQSRLISSGELRAPTTYWTGTLYNSTAYIFYIDLSSNPVRFETGSSRNHGGTIRCVVDPDYDPPYIPEVKPEDIPGSGNAEAITSYVGAFWKAAHKGERLIKIDLPADDVNNPYSGDWTVQVLDLGDFSDGDILFERWNGTLPTEHPDTAEIDTNPLSSAATTTLMGRAADGGTISFKMGLNDPIASSDHRYARVVVSFGTKGGVKYGHNIVLWLRQGDTPDHLFRNDNDDDAINDMQRTLSKAFSVYNLTAPELRSNNKGTPVSIQASVPSTARGGVFTEYPTQAGSLWHFAPLDPSSSQPYIYAMNPVYPHSFAAKPEGFTEHFERSYWDSNSTASGYTTRTLASIYETCPQNYRRPTDGSAVNTAITSPDATNSELGQSLWLNPAAGYTLMTDADLNGLWGYYADGFFDRRPKYAQPSGNYTESASAVNVNLPTVGYMGMLFYNHATSGSIFFPATGEHGLDGLKETGRWARYWTSSMAMTSAGIPAQAYALYLAKGYLRRTSASPYAGLPIRCVAE